MKYCTVIITTYYVEENWIEILRLLCENSNNVSIYLGNCAF